MAILELGIEINGLQPASNGLKDLQKTISGINGVKVDFGSSQLQDAKTQAIQANTAIKEMIASANIGNAKFLTELKGEGLKAKTELIGVSTEIKKLESASKIDLSEGLGRAKIETENARKALIEYNLEQKKLKELSKQSVSSSVIDLSSIDKLRDLSQEAKKLEAEMKRLDAVYDSVFTGFNKSDRTIKEWVRLRDKLSEVKKEMSSIEVPKLSYSQLSSELNKVRNEAKNLAAQMYQLTQSGQQATPQFQKLEKEFVDLKSKATQLDSGLKAIDGSLGQFQRNVGNYNGKVANANGVTMEFNRIIQDAPFGMMGIGNNIQQLAANWQVYSQQAKGAAAASGQTMTSMGLLKGVASNFLTTGNLLTFGIAAITSAWTAWTMWQQKSNKATKENKSALDEYKDSLSATKTLMLENEVEGRKEINRLNALKSVYDDVSQSQKTRKLAYQGVLKIYEDYNGKLTEEQRKVFDLGKAYDGLVGQILASAKARGYASIIDKNTESIIALEKEIEKNANTLIKSSNAYNAQKKALESNLKERKYSINELNREGTEIDKTARYYNELSDAQEKQSILINKKLKIEGENYSLQSKVLELTKQGAKLEGGEQGVKSTEKKNEALKEQFDYLQKIRDLLADKKQELDAFGLKGQAKELQELKNKYFDFYNELDKLEKKASKDKKAPKGTIGAIQDARGVGSDLENKQRAEIISKWNEIYVQLTSEGLTKAGLISENARQKELSGWSKYVADLKVKMSEASTDMNAVNEFTSDLLRNGTRMIELKFSIEDVEGIKKGAEKIAEDLNKPFTAKNPASLQSQIDERIRIFKDATIKLAEAMKLAGFNVDMKQVNGYINEQSIKIQKQGESDYGKRIAIDFKNKLVDEFNTSFKSFFTNLQSNVDELGLSFSSIFYSLGATLQSSINNVNTDSINNIFEKFKTSGWEAVKGIDAAVVGLSTAGNLIQSIVSQSSGVGQGIGGALSGAGAGLSIGSMLTETLGKNAGIWGAAIGGVVGLVSGIFGGKKKRKEEERQRQQLEEQKKTNALLERMNALAYTSSIIGGKTTDGIVTGVNRNEFGQITVRVEGKDLVTVLGRQNAIGSR